MSDFYPRAEKSEEDNLKNKVKSNIRQDVSKVSKVTVVSLVTYKANEANTELKPTSIKLTF